MNLTIKLITHQYQQLVALFNFNKKKKKKKNLLQPFVFIPTNETGFYDKFSLPEFNIS